MLKVGKERLDLDQVKYIKDDECKALVKKQDIKEK